MANNLQNEISSGIAILKELYNDGESEQERLMREFTNQCARLQGYPEIPEPKGMLTTLLYKDRPFLKLVKRKGANFQGVTLPVPLIYEKNSKT